MHAADASLALEAGKHVLVEKPFTVNAGEARHRRPRRGAGPARARGDVDPVSAAHGPHPRDHRRRHARRRAHAHRPTTPRCSPTTRAPHQRARARRRRAARPRHLPDLLRLGPLRRARTIQATATFKATGADAQVASIFGYDGGRMASTLSASDTKGPNTAPCSARRPHRDRPRLVHADDASGSSPPTERARGVPLRGHRARDALPGRGGRTPRRRGNLRATCCRSTRPSRSWRRSTRSASRSASLPGRVIVPAPIRTQRCLVTIRFCSGWPRTIPRVTDETDAAGEPPTTATPRRGRRDDRRRGRHIGH